MDVFPSFTQFSQSATNLSSPCFLLGHTHPGDGGGGMFVFDPQSIKVLDGGLVFTAPGRPPNEPGRWLRQNCHGQIDVRWFGARGDGQTDDAPAIQLAINALKRGSRLVIAEGEYVIGKRLRISQNDCIISGQGTLIPAEGMDDYLLEFAPGPRETVDFMRDTIGLRLTVECLRIDGRGRSRGLIIGNVYHCSFNDIRIFHTRECAVKFHGARESSLHNLTVDRCMSRRESLIDITLKDEPDPMGGGWQWKDGKQIDGMNNLRFYGLHIVHCSAPVFLDIGGETSEHIWAAPARAIHFNGAQIHLSHSNWFKKTGNPESFLRTQDWDYYEWDPGDSPEVLARIRNAHSISFHQCNFPSNNRKQDLTLILGDETGEARDCGFVSCRMPQIPFVAGNAKNINFIDCAFQDPWKQNQGGLSREEVISGPDATQVCFVPEFSSK